MLVISAATTGFGGAANTARATGYDDTFHFATASLYASDEALLSEETDFVPVPAEQSAAMADTTYYTCVDDCGGRYRHPGFYLGGEATVVKPFVGGSCLDTPCFITAARQVSEKALPDFDPYVAPRLWLGYTSCSGLGCRVRWWKLDLQASETLEISDPFETFTGEVDVSLEAETIDFEVTDALVLGQKWDLIVSGGVRYADFDWTNTADGTLSGFGGDLEYLTERGIGFEGLGATAALELYRPWFRRIGLFANLRGSLLYGKRRGLDVLVTNDELDPGRFAEGDLGGIVRSIWEAQLGVDWTHELWHGMFLTGRVAGEAQYWDSMLFNNTDLGFAGMTFTVGLIR
jgi:hypothetical protein